METDYGYCVQKNQYDVLDFIVYIVLSLAVSICSLFVRKVYGLFYFTRDTSKQFQHYSLF